MRFSRHRKIDYIINPFQGNIPFLYLLKTSENPWCSDVFRGYKKGTLAWNGLNRNQNVLIILLTKKKIVNVTYKLTKKNNDKHMQVNWRSKRKNQRKHGKQPPGTVYNNFFWKGLVHYKFLIDGVRIIEKLQLHLKWTLSRAFFVDFTKTTYFRFFRDWKNTYLIGENFVGFNFHRS